MKLRSLAALTFILTITAPAFGEDAVLPPGSTGAAPEYASEIIVTASALPEPLEAVPAAATVITRQQLEAKGADFVADALRDVPGLFIARSGSPGKAATLFTRGGNSTQTLVLWNGVEINNPYFSGFDWGNYSSAGVERVEVVRGPFSALYGSDAMTGVVNVPSSSTWTGLRASLESGQNGLFDGRAGGAWVSGAIRVEGEAQDRRDAGWYDNDDFTQDVASAGIKWAQGTASVALDTRFSRYDLGIPFNTSADGSALVPSPERRQNGKELQLTVPLEQAIGRFSYALTLSQNSRSDSFEDPQDPFGFSMSKTESTTRRANLVTRTDTPVGTLLIGGEFEQATVDDVSSYGTSLDGERRTSKSLFIEDRYGQSLGDRTRLELGIGVRSDDFDTFGRETTPRLSAAIITGGLKVRAAYGEGFRAPAIGELYFPLFGNAALDPERSRSVEAGVDRYWRNGSASLTLFANDFDNLIVFDNATSRFQNTGAARTRGVEAGASSALRAGISAGVSYTYLDTEQKDTGEALLRRPRHSGSANLAYARGPFGGMLSVSYGGERADVMPVFPYSRATNGAYTVADLNVHYDIAGLRPYLSIENLTDTRYDEVLGFRAPGRRALIGVRYSLK